MSTADRTWHPGPTPRLRRHRGERGAAAVQFIVVAPLLLLLLLMMIQWSIQLQAERVADAAAHEGAVAAAAFDGTEAAGHQMAQSYLSEVGSDLKDTSIHVSRGPETAQVTVEATVLRLLFSARVTKTAEVPVERFVE